LLVAAWVIEHAKSGHEEYYVRADADLSFYPTQRFGTGLDSGAAAGSSTEDAGTQPCQLRGRQIAEMPLTATKQTVASVSEVNAGRVHAPTTPGRRSYG